MPSNIPNPAPLRVVIITTGVSPIVRPILDSGHAIVGIVDCGGKDDAPPTSMSVLYRLLQTTYRFVQRGAPSLTSLAAKKGVPYYCADRAARDPKLASWIQERRPDVIVVYYAPILDQCIFTLPSLGTINLHPSLLPAYRGGHPLFWAVYNGDTQTGVTIHFVAARADTGDILYQQAFPIQPGMSESALERLAVDCHGVQLMLKTLTALASGTYPRIPQPEKSPTAAANRVNAEKLHKLIDWHHWPIERVWSVLRFAESWPCILPPPPRWKSLFRWTIGSYTQEPVTGLPGSIAQDRRGYYLVHPAGKIRLYVHYNLKRYIKSVLLRLKGGAATCSPYLLIIAYNQQFIPHLLAL